MKTSLNLILTPTRAIRFKLSPNSLVFHFSSDTSFFAKPSPSTGNLVRKARVLNHGKGGGGRITGPRLKVRVGDQREREERGNSNRNNEYILIST